MIPEESGYAQSSEFYDYTLLYLERLDIEFYLQLAEVTDGAILELGCGTGRILIPLAKTGYNVTGMDNSESMLAVCRGRIAEETEKLSRKFRNSSVDLAEQLILKAKLKQDSILQ